MFMYRVYSRDMKTDFEFWRAKHGCTFGAGTKNFIGRPTRGNSPAKIGRVLTADDKNFP